MFFSQQKRDLVSPGPEIRSWPSSLASLTVDFIKANLGKMLPSDTIDSVHREDSLALFDRDEIEVGKQLGKGSFSNVYEIKSFRAESTSTAKSWKTPSQMIIRSFYRQNATEEDTGNARYVVKYLRYSLMSRPKDFQLAAVDMAVEAHFLSSFRHPHILRLRGMAGDDVDAYINGRHDGYFLIFDRLEETLEQRLVTWRNQRDGADEPLSAFVERMTLQQKKPAHGGNYAEPLKYASQIGNALSYLHERDIMYRDLKPANIGICNGDVRLFDFGFCRQLPPSVVRDVNDTFQMTGLIGTRRYMSPEIALQRPYNLKVDVYSWSIVVWEMLSVEMPYENLNREKHLALVCRRGKRQRLDSSWPKAVRDLIQCSWANEISARPTMEEVCSRLECIIQEEGRKEIEPLKERKRTHSVVLELPPSFEIEKREPANNGTISTTTSMTRESISTARTTRSSPQDDQSRQETTASNY